MDCIHKINYILRHIKHVQDNCYHLGIKLIEKGDVTMGKNLISNSLLHDNSKFHGLEWEHLIPSETEDPLLNECISNHNKTNQHHPEYWGSIHEMPKIYLLEFLCDTKARSEEFGSSYATWLFETAAKRFGFTKEDETGKFLYENYLLLVETPFK